MTLCTCCVCIFPFDCERRQLEILHAIEAHLVLHSDACLECYCNAREYFTCLHAHTHSNTLGFASGFWLCFAWVGTKVSWLDVHSRGNHSSNSKITGSHMTSWIKNHVGCCNIVLWVLFVKLLPACIVCAALKQCTKRPRFPCPNITNLHSRLLLGFTRV